MPHDGICGSRAALRSRFRDSSVFSSVCSITGIRAVDGTLGKKTVPHSKIYFVLEQRKYKAITRGMWLRRRVRARQGPESDATAAQSWKADRMCIGSRRLQELCRPSRAVASERTFHRRLTPPANTVPALRASPNPAADCRRSLHPRARLDARFSQPAASPISRTPFIGVAVQTAF